MTRVLVTDARLGSAVAAIRSLGRSGYEVVAADSRPLSAGFYSRYAAERFRYPPPETEPRRVVDALLKAAHDRHIDLIIPVTDELVLPLAAARDEFRSVTTLALPSSEALAIARDKVETLNVAHELGIPTPRTTVVATVEASLEAAEKLGWPVVVKPQASRMLRENVGIDTFGVHYANTTADLEYRMRRLEGRCEVLLQEYCHGEARGVGVLADEGRSLSAFHYRRLREVPPTGGPSSFRESLPLEGVHYENAVRLLGALRWTGLAMVEFKGDDSAPKLMEINGRVWGSLALAVKSGVDFPAQAAELHLRGAGGIAQPDYSIGVRSRDLRLELSWIAAVLRLKRQYPFLATPARREALVAAMRLFRRDDGFDILSRDDPLAGLAEIGSLVPRIWAKARPRRLSMSQ